jgi:hypothetical protein
VSAQRAPDALARTGAGALVVAVMLASLAMAAVFSNITANPLSIEMRGYALFARIWVPEGWKFFTRDAQEPRSTIYERDLSSWRSLMSANGNPENWFGLKRAKARNG